MQCRQMGVTGACPEWPPLSGTSVGQIRRRFCSTPGIITRWIHPFRKSHNAGDKQFLLFYFLLLYLQNRHEWGRNEGNENRVSRKDPYYNVTLMNDFHVYETRSLINYLGLGPIQVMSKRIFYPPPLPFPLWIFFPREPFGTRCSNTSRWCSFQTYLTTRQWP